MKRAYIHFFVIMFLLVAVLLLFLSNKNQQKSHVAISSEPDRAEKRPDSIPRNSELAHRRTPQNFNNFAYEMSREICEQEKAAVGEIVWPSKKEFDALRPGDAVPESNVKLTPNETLKLLKRVTTSKCSSFRKDNTERFYLEFVLDRNNYATFYSHSDRAMGNGVNSYRLIKKALEALDKATEEETKQLRDMILYSLATFSKDSSTFVDIGDVIFATKEVIEKGLLPYPTAQQLENFRLHYMEVSQRDIKESQRLIKKYFSPDIDFLKMTLEELVNSYGYEGTQEELKRERRAFEEVRKLSQELNDLLSENFNADV